MHIQLLYETFIFIWIINLCNFLFSLDSLKHYDSPAPEMDAQGLQEWLDLYVYFPEKPYLECEFVNISDVNVSRQCFLYMYGWVNWPCISPPPSKRNLGNRCMPHIWRNVFLEEMPGTRKESATPKLLVCCGCENLNLVEVSLHSGRTRFVPQWLHGKIFWTISTSMGDLW